MFKIGQYNKLEVYRKVDFGAYLTDGEDEVLLPRKYIPEGTEEGHMLEVFLYTDSEDRPIATTLKPKAVVGDIKLMTVKDMTPVGAFLDWGLEKDLLVPFKEQRELMEQGKSYVVKVIHDKVSDRVIASNRYSAFTRHCTDQLKHGQEVEVIVCNHTDIGYVCLVNEEFLGMLYDNEIFNPVKTGDRTKAYVNRIRPDFKIDLVQRKPGFAGVEEQLPFILKKLKDAGGFLPYNSQSSPEDIKREFNMSKKVFKQNIGMLYKSRKIVIEDEGIRLCKK
jgi:predicted RNA-binding protein (virulence factor B family)